MVEVKVISGKRVTIPKATAEIKGGIEKGDILDITINKVYKKNNGLEALSLKDKESKLSESRSPFECEHREEGKC